MAYLEFSWRIQYFVLAKIPDKTRQSILQYLAFSTSLDFCPSIRYFPTTCMFYATFDPKNAALMRKANNLK